MASNVVLPNLVDNIPPNLLALAKELGIPEECGLTATVEPDKIAAIASLQKHRLQVFEAEKPRFGLRRQPSKVAYTTDEIYNVLEAALASRVPASQVEHLLQLLETPQTPKPPMLHRVLTKKSTQPSATTKTIDLATRLRSEIKNGYDVPLIKVLAPRVAKANLLGLNEALADAVRLRRLDAVRILLYSEAQAGSVLSSLPQHVGDDDLLLMQMLLSNGTCDQAHLNSVFVEAVKHQQPKAVLTMLTTYQQPTLSAINEATSYLMRTVDFKDDKDRWMLEILLAAGVQCSDDVHELLIKACKSITVERTKLAQILLRHKPTSIRYKDSEAIFQCMLRADSEMLSVLVETGTPDALTTSTAITRICPRLSDVIGTQRVSIFSILLSKVDLNAIHDALATAMVEVIRIHDHGVARFLRASGAIVDQQALYLAVQQSDPAMVEILCSSDHGIPPMSIAGSASGRVFGAVGNINDCVARLQIAKTLLEAGACGKEVDDLLRHAIGMQSQKRDRELISLLVTHHANVNHETCFESVMKDADHETFRLLLKGTLSGETLAKATLLAQRCSSNQDRLKFTTALIEAGAPGDAMSDALLSAMKEQPADVSYIQLLLRQDLSKGVLGNALKLVQELHRSDIRVELATVLLNHGASGVELDICLVNEARRPSPDMSLLQLLLNHRASIDHEEGEVLKVAVSRNDPKLFLILMFNASTSPVRSQTLTIMLDVIMQTPDLPKRFEFVEAIMHASKGRDMGDAINRALSQCMRLPVASTDLSFHKLLLDNGASIDYNDAEAISLCIASHRIEAMTQMLTYNPSNATMRKVFALCWKFRGDYRVLALDRVLAFNKKAKCLNLDDALLKAVKQKPCSKSLIKLLFKYQPALGRLGFDCMLEATRRGNREVLSLLIQHGASPDQILAVLNQASALESECWQSELAIDCMELLVNKVLDQSTIEETLLRAMQRYTASPIMDNFVEKLVRRGASGDYSEGKAILLAAQRGDLSLTRKLLRTKPSPAVCRMVFSAFLLQAQTSEADTVILRKVIEAQIGSFLSPKSSESAGIRSILFDCVEKWPESTDVLSGLVGAHRLMNKLERRTLSIVLGEGPPATEALGILLWAICKPGIPCNWDVIMFLLQAGVNPNVASSKQKLTPLLAAIVRERQELIPLLIEHKADVNQPNARHQTPLMVASSHGALNIMKSLMVAGAEKDDGSLHEAAYSCKAEAVQTLLDGGHDPQHLSTAHRLLTPLEFMCSTCVVTRENDLRKTVKILYRMHVRSKTTAKRTSCLLYALENEASAVPIVKELLAAGMHKDINNKANLYHKEGLVCSALSLIKNGTQHAESAELEQILEQSGCEEVYYHETDLLNQPLGFIRATAPEHIQNAYDIRQAQLLRMEIDREERQQRIERENEEAARRIEREDEEHKRAEARKAEAFQNDLHRHSQLFLLTQQEDDTRHISETNRHRQLFLLNAEEEAIHHDNDTSRRRQRFALDQGHEASRAAQNQTLQQQGHRLTLQQGDEVKKQRRAHTQADADQKLQLQRRNNNEDATHQHRMTNLNLDTAKQKAQLEIQTTEKAKLIEQSTSDTRINTQRKLQDMRREEHKEEDDSAHQRYRWEDKLNDGKARLLKEQGKLMGEQQRLTAQFSQKMLTNDDYYSPD